MDENVQELSEKGRLPDPYLSREAWLQIVKPVEMAGRLDHIPATKPNNKREQKTADLQNFYLTRKSIGGFSDNYDKIRWNHDKRD